MTRPMFLTAYWYYCIHKGWINTPQDYNFMQKFETKFNDFLSYATAHSNVGSASSKDAVVVELKKLGIACKYVGIKTIDKVTKPKHLLNLIRDIGCKAVRANYEGFIGYAVEAEELCLPIMKVVDGNVGYLYELLSDESAFNQVLCLSGLAAPHVAMDGGGKSHTGVITTTIGTGVLTTSTYDNISISNGSSHTSVLNTELLNQIPILVGMLEKRDVEISELKDRIETLAMQKESLCEDFRVIMNHHLDKAKKQIADLTKENKLLKAKITK